MTLNNSNNASRSHPITTMVASMANGENTINNGMEGNSHRTNVNRTEHTTAMPNAALNIIDMAIQRLRLKCQSLNN
jgi:hypothetical protein